ncbi:MFS transporter [Pseudonocardia kujensis]|uniref:MFS transporter n=1 Tax=Pseudonocardia kujensis TaxID=1128675 RepID=UPI001E5B8CFE|nr:MFS transporter [Pseudonocardia kujensis]MCE0764359.1 MFS transporter [Pseudonocardia kujensis]
MPLYPLYALFFADHGMSGAEISALFAVWSVTGLVAEVPSGALSDRFSRRRVLAAGGVLQAAAYALWLLAPGFPGFVAGFVLWGVATSLFSGTVEALVHEALSAAGAADRYAGVRGLVTAAGHAAQVPSAAASVLVATGGYALVGWVSVGTCLAAALLTCAFPDPPRAGPPDDGEGTEDTTGETVGDAAEDLSYGQTLRAGLAEAVGSRAVRGALLAAALVGGADALEEYFPLIVGQQESVALVAVPGLLVLVALAGAAGAALGGRAGGLRGGGLAALVFLAAAALLAAGHGGAGAAGLAALGTYYALQQCAQVVTDTRVQERLSGRARATSTSVSALGTELVALAVFTAWGLGGTPAVAVGLLALAPALWWLLRRA